MAVCPYCNTLVKGGERYCANCGFDLNRNSSPAGVAQPVQPEQNTQRAPPSEVSANQDGSVTFLVQNNGFPESLTQIDELVIEAMVNLGLKILSEVEVSKCVFEPTSRQEYRVSLRFSIQQDQKYLEAARNFVSAALVDYRQANEAEALQVRFRVNALSLKSPEMLDSLLKRAEEQFKGAALRWRNASDESLRDSQMRNLADFLSRLRELNVIVVARIMRESRDRVEEKLKAEITNANGKLKEVSTELDNIDKMAHGLLSDPSGRRDWSQFAKVPERIEKTMSEYTEWSTVSLSFSYCLYYVETGGDWEKLEDPFKLAAAEAGWFVRAKSKLVWDKTPDAEKIASAMRAIGTDKTKDALEQLALLAEDHADEIVPHLARFLTLMPTGTLNEQSEMLFRVLSKLVDKASEGFAGSIANLTMLTGQQDSRGFDGAFDVIAPLAINFPNETINVLPRLSELLENDKWKRGTDFSHLNIRNASVFLANLEQTHPRDVIPFVPRLGEMLCDTDTSTAGNAASVLWGLAKGYPTEVIDYLPFMVDAICRYSWNDKEWEPESRKILDALSSVFLDKKDDVVVRLSEISRMGWDTEKQAAQRLLSEIATDVRLSL